MKKIGYFACAFVVALTAWPLTPSRAASRCSPKTRFAVLDGGLVRDTLTNLLWQQDGSGTRVGCANGTACTWAEAKAYCAGLSLGTFSGFRLPTVKELSSLVDLTVTSDAKINQAAFPDTRTTEFWTSSPYAGSSLSGWAWIVRFSDGVSFFEAPGNTLLVRCVR